MKRKTFLICLTVLYAILMVFLLFVRVSGYHGDYLAGLKSHFLYVPLQTIKGYWWQIKAGGGWPVAYINLFGNVLMFMPMGLIIPDLNSKYARLFRFLGLVFVIDVVIELTQLFTLRGVCDIDDIILNMAGAFLGFVIYKLSR